MNKFDESARTKELNEEFRANRNYILSPEVKKRDDFEVLSHIVQNFDDFDNDLSDEHDYGEFEIDKEKFIWIIEYLDGDGESIDPSDPDVTTRKLTILLQSEFPMLGY